MEYTLDIFMKQPEALMRKMADSCKARRLEKALSRRSLSERTGIPAPTIEKFENTGKISLESFLTLVVEFGYFDEMSQILSKPKYTTGEELDTINKNRNRIKGR